MSDFVHVVWDRDPDDAEWRHIRAREARLEAVLAEAGFTPGLGEPLADVAGWLVALLGGGATEAVVIHHLQAAAAPASAYIPPPEQFTELAAALRAAYESVPRPPEAAA